MRNGCLILLLKKRRAPPRQKPGRGGGHVVVIVARPKPGALCLPPPIFQGEGEQFSTTDAQWARRSAPVLTRLQLSSHPPRM